MKHSLSRSVVVHPSITFCNSAPWSPLMIPKLFDLRKTSRSVPHNVWKKNSGELTFLAVGYYLANEYCLRYPSSTLFQDMSLGRISKKLKVKKYRALIHRKLSIETKSVLFLRKWFDWGRVVPFAVKKWIPFPPGTVQVTIIFLCLLLSHAIISPSSLHRPDPKQARRTCLTTS